MGPDQKDRTWEGSETEFCFTGAMRRSELVGLDVERLQEHPSGLVLSIRRPKTNQYEDHAELVAFPRAAIPGGAPLQQSPRGVDAANIHDGPLLRTVFKGNRPPPRRLPAGVVNTLVVNSLRRADIDLLGYSAHAFRAGVVTHAHLCGTTNGAIVHQTRHRSHAMPGGYVLTHEAWTDNAATQLR